MNKSYSFTSESVGEGHPDKIADQISDAIVDAYLENDKGARIACEAMVSRDFVVLCGEISSKVSVNHEEIVRGVIKEIGYTKEGSGFDYKTCRIIENFSKQSEDIALGVDEGRGLFLEQGAGDQGMVFGFACRDTKELMPLPIMLAHKLMIELAKKRKNEEFSFLMPDAKSQVTVRFDEGGNPLFVDTVVLSTQHVATMPYDKLHELMKNFIKDIIGKDLWRESSRCYINPTGVFTNGGPSCDAGLTGRKIIVDTYGGMSRHGGGAFSGKDPTKVDRSAAYAARYVAKNVVAANFAARCEVQIAYAIGMSQPVGIYVNTFGTNVVEEKIISEAIRSTFDLTPKGIIKMLNLSHQKYLPSAFGGHFGREDIFSWENVDKVDDLKKFI